MASLILFLFEFQRVRLYIAIKKMQILKREVIWAV